MRILLATDGSPSAIRAAARLAELVPLRDVEVRLLTVLSFMLDPYTLLGEELADTPDRRRVEQQAIEEATQKPRELLEKRGARISLAHRFGFIADEILEEIDEWEPDLVVMGRRGLSSAKRLILGSVSDRVSHHAKVPLLLVS
jgi:nucleotide-binding universal stress UspA family protein